MKTNNKLTSIQISVKHRDSLKKYCEQYGFNMSAVVEKLIDDKTQQQKLDCKFDGSGREVKGNTPFGTYDADEQFLKDCSNSMMWAVRRLGYPVIDIELTDIVFYALFEESVNTYNAIKKRKQTFSDINQEDKEWIRKYFLACCKETLGLIRQKFDTIPIPGGEVKLDGEELVAQSRVEKEFLFRNFL